MSKVAIMQPYFMPYIGYLQMVKAVDKFVFYDDVNYIKGGWINRNRILINGTPSYINIPQLKASSNKLINEIELNYKSKSFTNIFKTLDAAYRKAPYYNEVLEMLDSILKKKYNKNAEINIEGVKKVAKYLGLTTKFYTSSVNFSESIEIERTERIKYICKELNAKHYINAIGGQELYDKDDFKKSGIELSFIKSHPITYKQFDNEFVPWLSIIDVMMFNSVEEIGVMLEQYELV